MQAQLLLPPLFQICALFHEFADALDDITPLVLHLGVEVDVRNVELLGEHPRNQVFHIAIVAVAVAEHDDCLRGAIVEHERVGLTPFSSVDLVRASLVEFELVADVSCQVGHLDVLADGVGREFALQDLLEIGSPLCRSPINFLGRGIRLLLLLLSGAARLCGRGGVLGAVKLLFGDVDHF